MAVSNGGPPDDQERPGDHRCSGDVSPPRGGELDEAPQHGREDEGPTVMGAVDSAGEGPTMFVIAAIDRDGAWLRMPETEAPTLDIWR
jgi:hypothetical protein